MPFNDCGISASEFLNLCDMPIQRFSQVMVASTLDRKEEGLLQAWSGPQPILLIEFSEESRTEYLLVAVPDPGLHFRRISNPANFSAEVQRFFSDLAIDAGEEAEEFLGIFDLDVVLPPNPIWTEFHVSSAAFISGAGGSDEVGQCFGISMTLTLGVQIGVFRGPEPGASFTFNDSCEAILKHAQDRACRGLLQIIERQFPEREPSKFHLEYDWFAD